MAVPQQQGTVTGTPGFPEIAEALEEPGFAFVEGDRLRGALGLDAHAWQEFAAHWGDLVLDPYIGEGAVDQYRYRRYGRLALYPASGDDAGPRLEPLPNKDFQQDAEHVTKYGGRARRLDFVTPAFLDDPVLHQLIATDYGMLPVRTPEPLEVGLHAIRVVVNSDVDARPTPEGRHRDGHDYIAMHLIGKNGCRGGETLVYEQGSPGSEVIARMTLTDPLDTLIVDDSAVDHEVSRLEPVAGSGTRDVLLVAFYPLTMTEEES